MLCTLLTACATGSGHENFKAFMQRNVGKSIYDPSAYKNYYRDTFVTKKKLTNGNIEEEYESVKNCQVFFEIDNSTKKIVRWRYEGTEQDCSIVP